MLTKLCYDSPMNKTSAIIFHNGIACIVIIMALLLCREANIEERYDAQFKVADAIKAEKAEIRAQMIEDMKIQIEGLKLSGCSEKASFEATSVIVTGTKSTGPEYFAFSLYEIPLSKFMSMKPGIVWALLYCK